MAPATVLVVDDDAEIRNVLRLMLETGGYHVLEAANGRQAVVEILRQPVNLVLTDLIMPEQEGIETIQALRRDHPQPRIIAMSGAFGGEFLRIPKLLGAHSTLQKPLRMDDVLDAVARALAS